MGQQQVQACYQDDAEAVFKPIRAFFKRHALAAPFVHRVGPAGSTSTGFADQHESELVVLGTHGHGSVAGLVMGPVATKVVSLCSTLTPLFRQVLDLCREFAADLSGWRVVAVDAR